MLSLSKKGTYFIGRWEVDPLHNKIFDGSEQHDIEPKAMQVLEYLARNAGQTVHRDDLFKAAWPNQSVTEEALTRTIGHLRQCFADTPRSPNYIATIHKIGYRLIAKVYSGKTISVLGASNSAYLNEALTTISKVAVFLLATSLVYLVFDQPVTANLSKVKVRYITSDLGLEMAQALSPDGLNVVYKKYIESKNAFDQLYKSYIPVLMVKNIASHKVQRLSHPKGSASHPVWSPDSRFIAFANEIKLNDSKVQYGIYSTDVKTGVYTLHAETSSHNHGLTWSPDGRYIVYPDAPNGNEARALYSVDVRTNQLELIAPKNVEYNDIIYNYPKFSPDGNYIAVMRINRNSRRSIDLLDTKNYVSRNIYNSGEGLSSFEWKDDNTLFIADGSMVSKRLFEFSIDNGAIKSIPITDLDIEYLSYSQSSKRLTYESIYQPYNIEFINYTKDYEFQDYGFLTESNKRELEATESLDRKYTAIISSRSGAFEVWLQENSDQQARKLTSLQASAMNDLDWSPDNNFLSFVAETEYHKNAIYWVDVNSATLKMYSQKNSHHSIVGWESSDSILFTSDYKGEWKLWRLDVQTKTSSLATTGSISYGRLSPDRKTLYLSKHDVAGIWKSDIKNIRPVRIPGTENIGMSKSWAATDHGLIYYMYGDIGGYDDLYFFEFKTSKTRLISQSHGIYLNRINWSDNRVYYSLRGNRESDIALVENL